MWALQLELAVNTGSSTSRVWLARSTVRAAEGTRDCSVVGLGR